MLDPSDRRGILAASGWAELGSIEEAEAELEALSPDAQKHPDVLEVRWLIAARKCDWHEGLKHASKLIEIAPDRPTGWLNRAYALRRVPGGSVQEAMDALLPAFKKFPSESIIPYNIACYSCQLGDATGALVWLRKAISSGGLEMIRRLALDDPDLKLLHAQIREMK